jgi:hypothetical protein
VTVAPVTRIEEDNDILAWPMDEWRKGQANEQQGVTAKLEHKTVWQEAHQNGLATAKVATTALRALPRKTTVPG